MRKVAALNGGENGTEVWVRGGVGGGDYWVICQPCYLLLEIGWIRRVRVAGGVQG